MKLIFYQPHHHKNLDAIKRMCSSCLIQLEITEDFNRITRNDYDILISNRTFINPDLIPDNIKIIYGPQLWVIPTGELIGELNEKFKTRCVFNSLSDWVMQYYLELSKSFIIPISQFPYAVNTNLFKPKPKQEKELDCIVYIKRRSKIIIDKTIELLNQKSLKYEIFIYGSYYEYIYINALHKTKFLISLDAHESQGFALEEAMSCDVPLLVFDTSSMYDETNDDGNTYIYDYLKPNKLFATSVPYWSDSCGLKITNIDEMSNTIDNMIMNYKNFSPREYIMENLSEEVCMKRILDYFDLECDKKI